MDPASIFPAGSEPAKPKSYVDVTEDTFEVEVLDRSERVPVVIDFWAEWCAPCRQLGPVLERLAAEADGAWVLAKVDVESNQNLAAAAQVRNIPAVKAVIGRALVGEFVGALPEAQIRGWLDQLVQVAAEAGLPGEGPAAGRPGGDGPAEADGRAEADGQPETGAGDATADGAGTAGAPESAADDPALAAAAAEFGPLLAAVRASSGDERDEARQRLVELFDRFPEGDPRVVAARRELASALF